MAANRVGGHVGRRLRAEGGEREERKVRCTGECGFDLSVGKKKKKKSVCISNELSQLQL